MHVHGLAQGRESRAEIIVVDGVVNEIIHSTPVGRAPLITSEMRYFKEIVTARADEIVSRWIDYFVLHKIFQSERITRRLK